MSDIVGDMPVEAQESANLQQTKRPEFTLDYEVQLLAWFVLNSLEHSLFEHIQENYFSVDVTQWLYKTYKTYYDNYHTLPTQTTIENEHHTSNVLFSEDTVAYYTKYLDYIKTLTEDQQDYVKDTITSFISTRKLIETLNINTELISTGDWSGLLQTLHVTQPTFVHQEVDPFDPAVILNEFRTGENAIQSGIQLIDMNVGGLYKGELFLLLGGTNVGKSLLLINIGGNILRQYRKVLHVTLEMSVQRTMLRYYTTLGNLDGTMESLRKIPKYGMFLLKGETEYHKALYEGLDNYVKELGNIYRPYFRIAGFPSGTCTMNDLYKLVDIHQPEALLLDYVDLMKPIKARDAKRHESAELTTALRALAQERNILVLSPIQANRTAVNRRILGSDSIAEDYEKARIADNIVGMGQSSRDIPLNQVVLYIAKARNSIKGLAERYQINAEYMRFFFLQAEGIIVDEDDEESSRNTRPRPPANMVRSNTAPVENDIPHIPADTIRPVQTSTVIQNTVPPKLTD